MKLTDAIESLLKSKGDDRVLFVTPDQSVYEAIAQMAEEGVGALMVILSPCAIELTTYYTGIIAGVVSSAGNEHLAILE